VGTTQLVKAIQYSNCPVLKRYKISA